MGLVGLIIVIILVAIGGDFLRKRDYAMASTMAIVMIAIAAIDQYVGSDPLFPDPFPGWVQIVSGVVGAVLLLLAIAGWKFRPAPRVQVASNG